MRLEHIFDHGVAMDIFGALKWARSEVVKTTTDMYTKLCCSQSYGSFERCGVCAAIYVEHGDIAEHGQFPFIGWIHPGFEDEPVPLVIEAHNFRCVATLISPLYALTHVNCARQMKPNDSVVYYDVIYKEDKDEANAQKAVVLGVINLSASMDPRIGDIYDLALIEVADVFGYTGILNRLESPYPALPIRIAAGDPFLTNTQYTAYTIGYGKSAVRDTLTYHRTAFHSDDVCQLIWKKFYDGTICATAADGSSLLRREDDGAALVVVKDNVVKDNGPTLVGIGFVNIDWYGESLTGYIRVSNFCDQIAKYTSGAVVCE
uniref:Peptidase S1 domain-containing protein n=1 Tax=Steinernema glaseri TaxID=37863 RepID=A0A1I7ZY44_9BILA